MRLIAICLLVAGTLAIMAINAEAAFMEPSSEQIEAVVDNPAQIAQLLNGATPEDAVRVLIEVVQSIVAKSLPDEEQKARIARTTATLFRTMPDKAIELAELIAQLLPIEILPTIVAATAVVMGNQATTVTEAYVSKVARENTQIVRNAGTHPETVLSPALVLALGVPVSHAAIAAGRQPTAMPLAPPLTEIEGARVPKSSAPAVTPWTGPSPPSPAPPPPPPPIATNYPGL